MMRKVLVKTVGVVAVAAALVLCFQVALSSADQRDFTIVNATGYPIRFIGINPPGDEIWNENELDAVLPDGAGFRVEFAGIEKGCVWNIKVTWADDNTSSFFRDVNLCKINKITLKYNRSTDTASYTAE
ncbi:MAG TPA: hypothetical protein PK250_04650 [Syntrophobacter fumaroxidans]|nr:hypothetical protein [Syntrophobacter fumaroxidans]